MHGIRLGETAGFKTRIGWCEIGFQSLRPRRNKCSEWQSRNHSERKSVSKGSRPTNLDLNAWISLFPSLFSSIFHDFYLFPFPSLPLLYTNNNAMVQCRLCHHDLSTPAYHFQLPCNTATGTARTRPPYHQPVHPTCIIEDMDAGNPQ